MLLKNLIRTRIFKESKELRFEGGWSDLLGVKFLRGVVESENDSRWAVSVLWGGGYWGVLLEVGWSMITHIKRLVFGDDLFQF